jgi:hypothetical protein
MKGHTAFHMAAAQLCVVACVCSNAVVVVVALVAHCLTCAGSVLVDDDDVDDELNADSRANTVHSYQQMARLARTNIE